MMASIFKNLHIEILVLALDLSFQLREFGGGKAVDKFIHSTILSQISLKFWLFHWYKLSSFSFLRDIQKITILSVNSICLQRLFLLFPDFIFCHLTTVNYCVL